MLFLLLFFYGSTCKLSSELASFTTRRLHEGKTTPRVVFCSPCIHDIVKLIFSKFISTCKLLGDFFPPLRYGLRIKAGRQKQLSAQLTFSALCVHLSTICLLFTEMVRHRFDSRACTREVGHLTSVQRRRLSCSTRKINKISSFHSFSVVCFTLLSSGDTFVPLFSRPWFRARAGLSVSIQF